MTNKITKWAFALIFAVTASALIVRMFFGSSNSISYRIFNENEEGYYFYKALAILPSSYQDRYSKRVLDSFNDMKLISLVDDIESSHQDFIVLTIGAESKFLKAYPFDLVGVNMDTVERYGWSKHVSLLINVEVFNEYIHIKKITSKEENIKKYCSFISYPFDQSMHKILRSTSDIDSLITHRTLSNLEFIKSTGHLIDGKNIDFDQSHNTVYCWFYDTGVVKFDFTFNDDNTIKSVDSDIIGFLGNEMPRF